MNPQVRVTKNLEAMFNISDQANSQLVDVLAENKPSQLQPSDLVISTQDVITILTLNNTD